MLSLNSFAISSVSYCIKSPSYVFAGETYNVTVCINKNEISGSSKFEIVVPEGFVVESVNSSGANFIFDNNKAKFIWILTPKAETIDLSYNITVPKLYKGEEKIFRKFFYVKNNKVEEDEFYSVIDIVENDMLTQVVPEISENNIVYKIQIGAFANDISTNNLHVNTGNYKVEKLEEDNFYKFFIGNYVSVNEALSVMKKIGIKGAFVTAYNNGKRITIKESYKVKGY